jgi:DNA helicase II / ATP-dependent DNA helicase PcrA
VKFYADFHIHSRYSMATSASLVPEMIDLWAIKKGITVVGTGDIVHPLWLNELKQKLVPAEDGLYKLIKGCRHADTGDYPNGISPRFVLTGEISTIYKKNGKVRKIHSIIVAPSFDAIDKVVRQLRKVGNIGSDGRPVLGLDAQDLVDIVLSADDSAFVIPAHIWTPWFSVLGARSGFDSIDECYGDYAGSIFAVETGLSSDPPMNRQCSFLDKYTLVSNSDAHSLDAIGREANLFDTEICYSAIVKSLRGQDDGFKGTIEYFPQEGKYHLDGHRKCGICWEPQETIRHKGICPVCNKDVTIGVANRIASLADRLTGNDNVENCFRSVTPLRSIISEVLTCGIQTKKCTMLYEATVKKCGSEFNALLETPIAELNLISPLLAGGIENMRSGRVHLQSGYDGEFGLVSVLS